MSSPNGGHAAPDPGLYPPQGYRAAEPGGSSPIETSNDTPRSLGELISEITTDLSTLMRQEVELAKAELTQSAKRAGKGTGLFAGAGGAGHFVLLFLSISLWWALGDHLGYGWSALIVAILWGIAAAVMALMGKKEFSAIRGLDRTSETLGKIPNAVKGNEQENR
ncbi:Putative Holin-X, holin superfamily III [Nakamurella panacisegetis]|uniref:Putative Holin-X, holin superfamily III n=1 Tax=Nakamurella panacisegetis TaxID=1090615 RepID=A0A1H0RFV3_9ACTN|nr:phage holin family protein [Nakamurella panacisegetis]SDP28295.1 Putative Holin-X, holin superfamily III [Nakamurella panacisegetis]